MIVEYKMLVNEEIIEFKSIGKFKENVLEFKDKNNKENTILIYFLEDIVIITQEGITNMQNTYKINEKTEGFYKSSYNINSKTYCYTKQLNITKNELFIEYDFYFDGEFSSNNTLLIKY